MMCNKIILDSVIAESESAALDAAVSLSSLAPVCPVLCRHPPVLQMLLLEIFKYLVLILLGTAGNLYCQRHFSLAMSIWNQHHQSLCIAEPIYEPVVYIGLVRKMLKVNLSSAPRLKSCLMLEVCLVKELCPSSLGSLLHIPATPLFACQ